MPSKPIKIITFMCHAFIQTFDFKYCQLFMWSLVIKSSTSILGCLRHGYSYDAEKANPMVCGIYFQYMTDILCVIIPKGYIKARLQIKIFFLHVPSYLNIPVNITVYGKLTNQYYDKWDDFVFFIVHIPFFTTSHHHSYMMFMSHVCVRVCHISNRHFCLKDAFLELVIMNSLANRPVVRSNVV